MKYLIMDFMTKTIVATVDSSREGKIDKLKASPAITKAWNNAPLVGGGFSEKTSVIKGEEILSNSVLKDTKKMDVWAFADHLSRLDSDGNVYIVREDKQ